MTISFKFLNWTNTVGLPTVGLPRRLRGVVPFFNIDVIELKKELGCFACGIFTFEVNLAIRIMAVLYDVAMAVALPVALFETNGYMITASQVENIKF